MFDFSLYTVTHFGNNFSVFSIAFYNYVIFWLQNGRKKLFFDEIDEWEMNMYLNVLHTLDALVKGLKLLTYRIRKKNDIFFFNSGRTLL